MFLKEIAVYYDRPVNSRWHWNLFILFILIVNIFVSEAVARELEAINHIEKEMHNFLKQEVNANTEYEIGYLDQRLKLDKCSIPLEVFQPVGARQSGNSSLGVRCQGDKRWKIHVPVKFVQYAKVLTAKRTLTRGSALNTNDVKKIRMDVSRLSSDYFSDSSEIKGMVLKQRLKQGQVIRNGILEIPRLIKRGEIITILASTNTLSIRVKGEALMDGRKDDVIRVKNHGSNKVIQAKVISTGIVQVSM